MNFGLHLLQQIVIINVFSIIIFFSSISTRAVVLRLLVGWGFEREGERWRRLRSKKKTVASSLSILSFLLLSLFLSYLVSRRPHCSCRGDDSIRVQREQVRKRVHGLLERESLPCRRIGEEEEKSRKSVFRFSFFFIFFSSSLRLLQRILLPSFSSFSTPRCRGSPPRPCSWCSQA